ncbi:MAG: hypothetical protein KDD61_01350 [Bdellovibrionales bacterium]|nr:hypothetical protein [Bdellovibrionales bacterium]
MYLNGSVHADCYSDRLVTSASEIFEAMGDVKEKCDLQGDSIGLAKSGFIRKKSNFNLSLLWAQELVGADLAKKALNGNSTKIPVAVYELGNDKTRNCAIPGTLHRRCEGKAFRYQMHLTEVTGLVTGGSSAAGTNNANVLGIYSSQSFFDPAVWPIPGMEEDPYFVNLSQATQNEKFGMKINRISKETKSVPIIAAGNTGEYKDILFYRKIDAIKVGSTAVGGWIGPVSSKIAVDVWVPSDKLLASSTGSQALEFGATSGATPQVTSALVNFTAASGIRLNLQQAQLLLKKTNTPLFGPPFFSSGMLNAYKMTRVGDKIRNLSRDKNFDLNKALADPSLYDFLDEQKALQAVATKALSLSPLSCKGLKEAFTSLRKSFLLNPNKEDAKKLARIYRTLGLVANAQFYENQFVNPNLDQIVRSLNEMRSVAPELLESHALASIFRAINTDKEKRELVLKVFKHSEHRSDIQLALFELDRMSGGRKSLQEIYPSAKGVLKEEMDRLFQSK